MNSNQGFSIIEVIIALAFFSISALGIATMQLAAINGNSRAHIMTDASSYLMGLAETIMAMPYQSVNDDKLNELAANLPQKYNFTSKISEEDYDFDGQGDVKKIEMNIEWKLKKEKNIKFNLIKSKG